MSPFLISTIVLALLFVWIFVSERKCSRRFKDFIRKSDEDIAGLARHVSDKYRAKHGRDPTGKINTFAAKTPTKPPA